ncbi:MAG: acylphosphatase [bacterium]|nr:acylphosphatase [bacterium]
MTDVKRIHAFVNGRVQGVGFRYFVQSAARALYLVGEVRNLQDRRVEVMAEGTERDLKTLIKRLHEGPPMSRVESVEVDWEPPRGVYADFLITH